MLEEEEEEEKEKEEEEEETQDRAAGSELGPHSELLPKSELIILLSISTHHENKLRELRFSFSRL